MASDKKRAGALSVGADEDYQAAGLWSGRGKVTKARFCGFDYGGTLTGDDMVAVLELTIQPKKKTDNDGKPVIQIWTMGGKIGEWVFGKKGATIKGRKPATNCNFRVFYKSLQKLGFSLADIIAADFVGLDADWFRAEIARNFRKGKDKDSKPNEVLCVEKLYGAADAGESGEGGDEGDEEEAGEDAAGEGDDDDDEGGEDSGDDDESDGDGEGIDMDAAGTAAVVAALGRKTFKVPGLSVSKIAAAVMVSLKNNDDLDQEEKEEIATHASDEEFYESPERPWNVKSGKLKLKLKK